MSETDEVETDKSDKASLGGILKPFLASTHEFVLRPSVLVPSSSIEPRDPSLACKWVFRSRSLRAGVVRRGSSSGAG